MESKSLNSPNSNLPPPSLGMEVETSEWISDTENHTGDDASNMAADHDVNKHKIAQN